MTRINVGIDPSLLCDQHLAAEYRELPRIYNLAVRYRDHIRCPFVRDGVIPSSFRLGKGHMKFFIDKGRYLEQRWRSICDERRRRGHVVNLSWRSWPANLNGNWTPSIEDRRIVEVRVAERLARMRSNPDESKHPRWTGAILVP